MLDPVTDGLFMRIDNGTFDMSPIVVFTVGNGSNCTNSDLKKRMVTFYLVGRPFLA